MSEIEYHEIEFTTWELKPENLEGCNAFLEPVMRVQAVLDPCTNSRIGLFFQHRLKLYSGEFLILDCIAEQVFICAVIFSYTFPEMKELLATAHERFKIKLLERAGAESITFSLDCLVNDFEVEQVMKQLQK